MRIRHYDRDRDREHIMRIWREVGWYRAGHDEAYDLVLGAGTALVAELDGEAECLALSARGTLRYLDDTIPFAGITAVSTSRVARHQGLAGRTTAAVLARDAAEGAAVAGLGIFEQGFYNRLGFGNGSYTVFLSFDPAQLEIPATHRVPQRLRAEDWEAVHRNRLARAGVHGQVNLTTPDITRADMVWDDKSFGLGYRDGPGNELTHHVWLEAEDAAHGPYEVKWLVYRTREQFLELMSLLSSLADQVRRLRMDEPAGIQLQDLLRHPLRQYDATAGAKYAAESWAVAHWQMRILDMATCLQHTHLQGPALRFNLELTDPVGRFLDDSAPWRGIAGEYVITLGQESSVQAGARPELPDLRASVNAFTRLWLGIRPATGLATTDDLSGPPDLLYRLDRLLQLPTPCPDWDY